MPRSPRAVSSRSLAAVAALGVAFGGGVAASPAGAAPKISTFTLENGMRGVVIEDHRAPVVTHMVWYRVGAADEPPRQTGIAHFLEHLMFKGTDAYPGTAFTDIVSANGGQLNAFTSRDYTAYHERVAKDRLPLMMEMEADRMTGLRLSDEATVVSERDVVLEERSMRTDNEPSGRFREQFSAQLYIHHPYGSPVIGWRKEIEGLGPDEALAFYDRFYGPENALLVVAGDVSPEDVEALAQEHYGPIAARGVNPAPRPQEPPHYAARRLDMHDARVRQPYVMRGWLVPSVVSAENPSDAAALEMLSEILGGRQTSRLWKTLVTEENIALYSGGYYFEEAIDDSEFAIYAVPAPGVDMQTLEDRMNAVVARLAKDGPDANELRRAKTAMLADYIYAQDSQETLARAYGASLTIGLTVEDVAAWPDRIDAVTAEDVAAAARTHLRAENSVTGWLRAPEDDAQDDSQTDAPAQDADQTAEAAE